MDYNNRVMSKDLYRILGIDCNADDREIRAAYRSRAKKFHPDAGRGASAEKFREIQDAYEILADPVRRNAYDRRRREWQPRSPVYRDSPWARPQTGASRDAYHIDLRTVLGGPRGEPIGVRRPPAGTWGRGYDPEDELEILLRLLMRFRHPDR